MSLTRLWEQHHYLQEHNLKNLEQHSKYRISHDVYWNRNPKNREPHPKKRERRPEKRLFLMQPEHISLADYASL
ncbi:MAG: hypothetical protein AB7V39_08485 [Nitrospiraceae bacterium]